MGNETSSGNAVRDVVVSNRTISVHLLQNTLQIGGTIISMTKIANHDIVIVVNKRIWYGIRLVIYDSRYTHNRNDTDLFEVIQLTSSLGIDENDVDTSINRITNIFVCYI